MSHIESHNQSCDVHFYNELAVFSATKFQEL